MDYMYLCQVLSQQKVMRCFLSFVVRNDHAPTTWSTAQFEELQLLVHMYTYFMCVLSTVHLYCAVGPVLSVWSCSSVSGGLHGLPGEHSPATSTRMVLQDRQ